jgi:C4-dicarboxylate-specific signal transduction histidine kinase
LQQIFDPFFTTKNPGEGTGLGLSICYSIMEGLGGSINAANHPDGGAEFTIHLPIRNNAGGGMQDSA